MRFFFTGIAAGMMILLAVSLAGADGMRCGNDIVNIHDSAFMVIKKCGEPITKIHVGYTINETEKREFVIEDWVYGPRNDYYYFVTMVGGRVSKIRSERQ